MKEIHRPFYSNDSDTQIEYLAIYRDDETGKETGRNPVVVNRGDPLFDKIVREWTDEVLKVHKRERLHALQRERAQAMNHGRQRAEEQEQAVLFRLKADMFDLALMRSAPRAYRRQLRKAQSLEEARLIAAVAAFTQLHPDVELDESRIPALFERLSDRDGEE